MDVDKLTEHLKDHTKIKEFISHIERLKCNLDDNGSPSPKRSSGSVSRTPPRLISATDALKRQHLELDHESNHDVDAADMKRRRIMG